VGVSGAVTFGEAEEAQDQAAAAHQYGPEDNASVVLSDDAVNQQSNPGYLCSQKESFPQIHLA